MDYKQIIWLASYPKSGNTWVRLFLDAYFLGELDINEIICSIADDRADKQQIGDGSDVVTMPVDVQQLTRPMGLLRLVRAYNNEGSKLPLFVKTHTGNFLANGIELLPETLTKSVVHIVRDPRDVLPSFAKHMGRDIDTALEWMQDKYRTINGDETRVADYISSWSYHTNSFLNTDTHNVHLVRYEDLRANPIGAFAGILKHAGIEPDMTKVAKAVQMTELSRLRKTEASDGFRESSPHAKDQFFGAGKVGGFHDKLTPRQIHLIEKACRTHMKRLGYLKKRAA